MKNKSSLQGCIWGFLRYRRVRFPHPLPEIQIYRNSAIDLVVIGEDDLLTDHCKSVDNSPCSQPYCLHKDSNIQLYFWISSVAVQVNNWLSLYPLLLCPVWGGFWKNRGRDQNERCPLDKDIFIHITQILILWFLSSLNYFLERGNEGTCLKFNCTNLSFLVCHCS